MAIGTVKGASVGSTLRARFQTLLDSGESQSQDIGAAFDRKAEDWQRYTETPLGRLRQELTLYNLVQRLAGRPGPLSILDAGAGTGGYALALARCGHRVTLLDVSPAMLAVAQRQIVLEDPVLTERTRLYCAPLQNAIRDLAEQRFDVVLVHTLLEYLDDPWEALHSLVMLLAPGGVISILTANPAAIAFRWAIQRGDPERALTALGEQVAPADLFGVPRRTLNLQAVLGALGDAGLIDVTHWGVRIFADYGPAERLDDTGFYESIWRLELATAGRDPYRGIARYHHVLGEKLGESSGDL